MNPLEYLRDFLKENRLKQKELAEKIGFSASAVSNILSGRAHISGEFARRMEEFYGMNATFLQTGAGKPRDGDGVVSSVEKSVYSLKVKTEVETEVKVYASSLSEAKELAKEMVHQVMHGSKPEKIRLSE